MANVPIWSPFSIVRAIFPARDPAHAAAVRWNRVASREPQLANDMIRLGRLLELPDQTFTDGVGVTDDKTQYQLGVEAGRRALALEILAMMKIDPADLEEKMEIEQ